MASILKRFPSVQSQWPVTLDAEHDAGRSILICGNTAVGAELPKAEATTTL